jgi:predicted nucleic acid-binding protein
VFVIDTNLVLSIVDPQRDRAPAAIALLDSLEQSSEACLAPQCLFEAWVVLTRPSHENAYGFSPDVAYQWMTKLQDRFSLLPDPSNLVDIWQKLCRDHGIVGKRAHDARIVAFAAIHKLDGIVTINASHFEGLGVPVLSPINP